MAGPCGPERSFLPTFLAILNSVKGMKNRSAFDKDIGLQCRVRLEKGQTR